MTMINLTPAGCDSYGTEPAQDVLLLNAAASPAQNLSGPELDAWMASAEDESFLAAMQDMCSNRVPVPAGLASLPPLGGAL